MTDLAQRLAARLTPYVDRGTLAGAVLHVSDAERTLAEVCIGSADREAQVAMRPDHMMWIASISKPITGAALMLLVDEGRIDLDAPIERWLPEFKGQQVEMAKSAECAVVRANTAPITVRQCMAHTSGLPFMSRPEAGKIDTMTLREAALTYAMTPLVAAPGTAYGYSNAGINTVGRVIEVVTGQPFDVFLQERLLAPLGMRETAFVPSAAQVARLAKTYQPTEDKTGLRPIPIGQCTYPLDAPTRQPAPAGGLFATAGDVARFGRMVLGRGVFEGRRLLSEAAIATMTAKQTGALEKSYGVGWDVGPQSCGHGGAYATDLRLFPHQGRVAVYFVQHAGYANADGGEILPAFHQEALAAAAKA